MAASKPTAGELRAFMDEPLAGDEEDPRDRRDEDPGNAHAHEDSFEPESEPFLDRAELAAEAKARAAAMQKTASEDAWWWAGWAVRVYPVREGSGRPSAEEAGQRRLEALVTECDLIELGLSVGTLMAYRRTFHAWPEEQRKDASFSAHKALGAHPNRFEILEDGMSERAAKAALAAHVGTVPTPAPGIGEDELGEGPEERQEPDPEPTDAPAPLGLDPAEQAPTQEPAEAEGLDDLEVDASTVEKPAAVTSPPTPDPLEEALEAVQWWMAELAVGLEEGLPAEVKATWVKHLNAIAAGAWQMGLTA